MIAASYLEASSISAGKGDSGCIDARNCAPTCRKSIEPRVQPCKPVGTTAAFRSPRGAFVMHVSYRSLRITAGVEQRGKRTKRAPAESPVAKCRKACEVAPGGLEVTVHSQRLLSSLMQSGGTLRENIPTSLPLCYPISGLTAPSVRIWPSGCGCGGGRNAGRSRDIRDKDL